MEEIEENSSSSSEGEEGDQVLQQERKTQESLDQGVSSDEDEEAEWEEVPEAKEEEMEKEPIHSIPEGGLIITIPVNNGVKKKKGATVEDLVRLEFNKVRREEQEFMHKGSLLCFLSRGVMVNNILNMQDLRGLVLSWNPPQLPIGQKVDMHFIRSCIWWVKNTLLLRRQPGQSPKKGKTVQPVMIQDRCGDDEQSANDIEQLLQKCLGSEPLKTLSIQCLVFLAIIVFRTVGVHTRLCYNLQPVDLKPKMEDLMRKPVVKDDEDEKGEQGSNVNSRGGEKKKNQKDKNKGRRKMENSESEEEGSDEDEDDSWNDGDPIGKKTKKKVALPKKKRQQSSKEGFIPVDFWLEAYLEEEKKWVSVDVRLGKAEQDQALEGKASKPMIYVVAFDNDGCIKDVTKRYCSRWFHIIPKRVDSYWWEKTLEPYKSAASVRERHEDKCVDELVLKRSYPVTVQDLRVHPLYTAAHFLRQNEMIYPPNAQPAGRIKSWPFYSRDKVKLLYSREAWLKQAKVVRIGEEPVKTTKARAKYNRDLFTFMPNDKPVELFGEWQVEDYIPPIAKDGKVPRNEYGNVELFKPEMLPRGCAHLPLPGLQRIAKKLNIDCAPALTGFEFSGRGSHPIYDGFVVCQENAELLTDAWNQEQDEHRRKEEEKRKLRVYANWKRLIRGVLIRERLLKKYSWEEPADSTPSTSKAVPKEKSVASNRGDENKTLPELSSDGPKKPHSTKRKLDVEDPPTPTKRTRSQCKK